MKDERLKMKDNGSQHKKDAGRLQRRCQRHQDERLKMKD